ncbi:hypothetical protein LPJ38_30925 [Bradyrhizobium daqingense]|uniref:DUF1835 domain-containing protein n=1 Tax=Bradyrhizobium daqingense TaxID=993502 RepID=A0A562LPX2_9BRAD|nr:hypothetical protein [Bradyrhizobium daqingense]TWI09681.1 hypothetical protein IQ17_00760 [Bradyrhizobium daqingense]UFS88005.1 hypothetical protein LPJ38_30925 [Bradyrhizobium daqingense]
MSRLILATNHLDEDVLRQSRQANVVLGFYPRFVRRKLPSEEQLLMGLERRSAKHGNSGDHWLDDACRGSLEGFGTRDIGFFELCSKFDSIEIWVDPRPNDQLVLVWLLDLLRPYKEITTKLSLVHTDDHVAYYSPESVAKWKLPAFKVTENHLVLARRAWQAYRAETPQPCFDLLMTDLTILPRLRPALIALLEELPDNVTGLGASEMDILDFVNDGHTDPRRVTEAYRMRDVFDEDDAREALLELGAYSAPPILLGDPAFNNEDRYFGRSEWKVTLTELGRSLLAGEDDMWRHNRIERGWGGTELTNERLWRWDRESRSLVAP